jgi:opacity protein-like surface antigen
MIFKKNCTALNTVLGLILTTYMAEGICASCEYQEEDCCTQQPILEAKAGYFFFSDSKMRKVYNDGGIDLQISGSYPLWNWIQLYGSVEYLQKHGRSLGGHQKTRIWAVPLSLGLEPVFTINRLVDYYFTVGPRYFFVHAHNDSSSLDRHKSQNGLGGFINTGFHFFPWDNLVIDVFGEYSYKRMHFHTSKRNVFTREVQVGGFAFGAGIGYAF